MLEVRNLNKFYNSRYGWVQALKNVNIEIPEKSITAFIGPSGCGKSTFLKTLNRMNDLVDGVRMDGEILVDGAHQAGTEDVCGVILYDLQAVDAGLDLVGNLGNGSFFPLGILHHFYNL